MVPAFETKNRWRGEREKEKEEERERGSMEAVGGPWRLHEFHGGCLRVYRAGGGALPCFDQLEAS